MFYSKNICILGSKLMITRAEKDRSISCMFIAPDESCEPQNHAIKSLPRLQISQACAVSITLLRLFLVSDCIPRVQPRIHIQDEMEMRKIACAVLVAAATATGALAAEAPAPGPASGAASLPAAGAALGVAVLSFVACYLQ